MQVIIMDELSINDYDVKKMKPCETSELEETLTWLADNTTMTLAALSLTSLLDRRTGAGAICQTVLDEIIVTGFMTVSLEQTHYEVQPHKKYCSSHLTSHQSPSPPQTHG